MTKHSHYKKDVRHLSMIDPYRVCQLWGPMSEPQQHALKKVLVAGERGSKGIDKDIQEAIDSLVRWQEMRAEDRLAAAPEFVEIGEDDVVPIGIKQMHPDARMPTYATDGSACFDLYAVDTMNIQPHPNDRQAKWVRTGLAFSIPEGWMIEIHSRSGHGFKNALRLSNCTGIIDGDYTDEVMVALRCDGEEPVTVKDGHRIAQARIVPVERAGFHWIDDIPTTGRGGGLGSTGS